MLPSFSWRPGRGHEGETRDRCLPVWGIALHRGLLDQRENQYAAVILIGDGPEVKELDVNVGDRIYIQKFGGVDIKQRVGGDYFWLEVLHQLDVYITYPDDGAELEQTDADSRAPEYKPQPQRAVR